MSGLVGSEKDRANRNVVNWLASAIVVHGKKIETHVKAQYEACLNAPNYTVFSNTTAATPAVVLLHHAGRRNVIRLDKVRVTAKVLARIGIGIAAMLTSTLAFYELSHRVARLAERIQSILSDLTPAA
ncbi:hypothetical protein WJ32_22350 [Burkholderia ubonensis]|uniref:Uncharacterized protein n=1 Tax=Burkholderia ubonensis TaxID=101571 RepID=A0A118HKZ9_9BURK|nr:hypothetical protein [Burkholderia ubonensis]AOJ65248.1 hypothetical protein WJ32_22350 [Burkholderia ubonensis]KVG55486.1 hypothetical protein WJ33_05290 [Burkholderia ubonensis]